MSPKVDRTRLCAKRNKSTLILVLCIALFSSVSIPGAVDAEETGWRDLQLRLGASVRKNYQEYRMIELGSTYRLPYTWQLSSDWSVLTGLDLKVGCLKGENNEYPVIGSVGPALLWKTPVQSLSIVTGIRAALISDHKIGEEDVGGAFTFVEELGVGYRLNNRFSVECFYQHISNGGLYNNNPGLDLLMVGIIYRF